MSDWRTSREILTRTMAGDDLRRSETVLRTLEKSSRRCRRSSPVGSYGANKFSSLVFPKRVKKHVSESILDVRQTSSVVHVMSVSAR